MTDFEKLSSLINGMELPVSGENSNGETVIIEGNKAVIITTTVQKNGWCRINEYYPDGLVTEMYER